MARLQRRIDPVLLLVLALSLPALAPLFAPGYFYEAHDGRHSVFYQVMFDAALRDGALWPRWAMSHLQGYGYPTFIILAPLGFWLGELFVLLGASFTQAARLTWATGVLLSGWGMLALLRWWLIEQPGAPGRALHAAPAVGRRVVSLEMAAAAGALLYVYAPYRLADIYVRGALNESLLLLWLPWLLLAWDRLLVISGPGARVRWLLAVLSLAGMWLTHSFAILSLTPVLVAWILFRLAQRGLAERGAGGAAMRNLVGRAGAAASAGVAALLLCAVFLVPLFAESPLLDQQVYTSDTYDFRAHFVQVGQYFSPFWGYGYSDDSTGAGDGMGFQVGAVMLAAALAGVATLRQMHRTLRPLMAMLALLSLGLLLLMTPLARPLWEAIPTLAVIQFPWRLLVATSFTVSALGALLLGGLTAEESRLHAGAASAGAGALVVGLLALVGSAGYAAPQTQPVEPWREDGRAVFRFEQEFPDMIVGTIWTTEAFTVSPMSAGYADPAYAEVHGRTHSLERLSIVSGEGQVLRQDTAGATFGGLVEMATPGVVRLNLLDFPGWRVTIDGKPVSYRRLRQPHPTPAHRRFRRARRQTIRSAYLFPLPVEPVHRRCCAFSQNRLHSIGSETDRLVDCRLLCRTEPAQYIIGRIPFGWRPADAELHPDKLVGSQLSDHRINSFVSAGAAPLTDPQTSRRQVEIIVDHNNICGNDFVKLGGFAYGCSAEVHKGLRFDKQHRAAGPVLTDFCFKTSLPGFAAPTPGQFIDDQKADIMSGILIPGAGIAQAHHNFQRSSPPYQVSNRRLTDRSS